MLIHGKEGKKMHQLEDLEGEFKLNLVGKLPVIE